MKNKEMAKEYHININSFKYADLLTCEWFVYVDKRTTIYFTDNINPCRYCIETRLSYVFRQLGLIKYIRFGKPKTIQSIEPPPEPLFKEEKEMPNYRIRLAGKKIEEN